MAQAAARGRNAVGTDDEHFDPLASHPPADQQADRLQQMAAHRTGPPEPPLAG